MQELLAAGCATAHARVFQTPGVLLLLKCFQGFPTRDWCQAIVPWLLSQPSRGSPGRAVISAAGAAWDGPVSRCGWQEGQRLLGREKGEILHPRRKPAGRQRHGRRREGALLQRVTVGPEEAG